MVKKIVRRRTDKVSLFCTLLFVFGIRVVTDDPDVIRHTMIKV